jgi:hypothetical protein
MDPSGDFPRRTTGHDEKNWSRRAGTLRMFITSLLSDLMYPLAGKV